MPSFPKPCLVCGKLSKQSRCAIHEAEYKARRLAAYDTPERRAKKQMLYNSDYRKRRAELVANATHCHLCKRPFTVTDAIEADHLEPGNPNSPLAPAHRFCNQSRGNRPLTP